MTARTYDFYERLRFSTQHKRLDDDLDTIKDMVAGCAGVRKSRPEEETKGIDYVATLEDGADLNIDAKRRDIGASRYWRNGPDLALELWNVMPTPWYEGKTGWTLDKAKETDLVLFVFDPSDTDDCYLVGFQHLRMALEKYQPIWTAMYRVSIQRTVLNGEVSHFSQCVFVPASVVINAIVLVSLGHMSHERR